PTCAPRPPHRGAAREPLPFQHALRPGRKAPRNRHAGPTVTTRGQRRHDAEQPAHPPVKWRPGPLVDDTCNGTNWMGLECAMSSLELVQTVRIEYHVIIEEGNQVRLHEAKGHISLPRE